MASTNLLAGLLLGAQHFVNVVKFKLNAGGYPKGDSSRNQSSIQDAMSIEPPQPKGDSGAYINIVIDLQSAPYGAAYEFGSGEHATAGPAGKYPITPRKKDSVLAFEWEKVGKKVFFTEVDHPGVEAKPYLRPTLSEEANKIAEIIGEKFESDLIMQIFEGKTVKEEKIVVKI